MTGPNQTRISVLRENKLVPLLPIDPNADLVKEQPWEGLLQLTAGAAPSRSGRGTWDIGNLMGCITTLQAYILLLYLFVSQNQAVTRLIPNLSYSGHAKVC
jgi:hypothetical protein